MQTYPNLWWQALLLVPLVMVAWLLVRLLRRQSRAGKAPQLFRFLVLSALVHVLILFALDLVHVTTQFAELHPELMEEIVRTFSGEESAEPVQLPWERLPEPPAPEPPESSVATERRQANHFVPELVGTPATISAAQAMELSPERVLFVPPPPVADAPSSALARARPSVAPVEPELPAAELPEPVPPSPDAAPRDSTVAMERRTTDAPQRDLTAHRPDALREPTVPPKMPHRSSASPNLPRVEPATAPPRDRTLVSSPDVPFVETATPARVAKGDEPILADITVPGAKQPTTLMTSTGAKPAEMPVARTPIRPSTLTPGAIAEPRRMVEPPRLDAPAVADADRLRGRVRTFDLSEPPPVSRVMGPAQGSPLQEVALPVDRQPTSVIRMPQVGANMAAISFPATSPTQLAQTAVPRRDRVPDSRPAASAVSVARAPVRIESVSVAAELPGLRIAEKAEKLESSETAIVLARTTANAPAPAATTALSRLPVEPVDAKPRRSDVVVQRVNPRDPELKSVTAVLPKQPARGGPVNFVTDELAIKLSLTVRQENTRQQLVEVMGGSKETEAAVERGLAWLAAHQGPEGNWSLHNLHCKGHQCDAAGSVQSDTAATALALLPFLGAGHTHTQGKYIETVRRGMLWLVAHQKPDGDLSVAGGQAQMYSHALATITLCELFGMSGDRILYSPTTQALRFISEAQDPNSGGWRYTPRSGGDTSVVGWQLMALKSGEMAGFYVAPEVYERAGRWLDATSSGARRELYSYQPGSGGTPAMTAEAALSRQFLGWQRTADSMLASADYLQANPPAATARNAYYWYYATQVMFHMQGEHWSTWNARLREVLLGSQVKDGPAAGSWHPRTPSPDTYGDQGGRIYETGLALLMLEVYYRHLPLYQQLESSSR